MAKSPSLADQMNKLKTIGTKSASKSSGPERAVADIDPNELPAFGVVASLRILIKKLQSRLDSADDQAKASAFHATTASFWKQKAKPASSLIVVPDENGQPLHDLLYQMQDRFTQLAQFKNRDAIIEALTAGEDDDFSRLTAVQAETLVEAEILTDPTMRLRYTLSELAEGHFEKNSSSSGSRFIEATDAEKAMGKKLADYILADASPKGTVTVSALTDDEKAYLVVWDDRIKFRDVKGFMARVCTYLTSQHQLRRVLMTFNPVRMFHPVHFAVGKNDMEKRAMLAEIVTSVLGAADLKDE